MEDPKRNAFLFWWGGLVGATTAAEGALARARQAIGELRRLGFGESGTPFPAAAAETTPETAGDDRRGCSEVPLPNTSGTFPAAPRGCVCNPDEHAATFTRVWVCTHCGARRPGADPVPPTSGTSAEAVSLSADVVADLFYRVKKLLSDPPNVAPAGNLNDVAATVCPTVDDQLPADAARLAQIARLPGPICGVQGCRCEPTPGHAYCHSHGELLDGFDWNGTAWVRL